MFDQIEIKMTDYVMQNLNVDRAEANRLRVQYWRDHGTTLAGLMRLHDVDPMPYLTDVHAVDFSVLAPDPVLAAQIGALPGRRIIFTNGTRDYAQKVVNARGLTGLFDAIYGVEEAGLHPKPDPQAFEKVFDLDGLRPKTAAMFEDDPRNLAVPHALGMRTVHIAQAPQPEAHIHHHTDDLTAFLAQLT